MLSGKGHDKRLFGSKQLFKVIYNKYYVINDAYINIYYLYVILLFCTKIPCIFKHDPNSNHYYVVCLFPNQMVWFC